MLLFISECECEYLCMKNVNVGVYGVVLLEGEVQKKEKKKMEKNRKLVWVKVKGRRNLSGWLKE